MTRRVVSVGNRRDYPRELWGPRDHEAERLESERIGAPLKHAPGGAAPELKFSLHKAPVIGGVRSKAIDELVARYTGRR